MNKFLLALVGTAMIGLAAGCSPCGRNTCKPKPRRSLCNPCMQQQRVSPTPAPCPTGTCRLVTPGY